jgi:hypothetical protein
MKTRNLLVFAGPFVAGLYSSRENGAFQQGTPSGKGGTRKRALWDIYRNARSANILRPRCFGIGKETKVFLLNRGRRKDLRNRERPRGFAIKFYTEDGNWDLVGNNAGF